MSLNVVSKLGKGEWIRCGLGVIAVYGVALLVFRDQLQVVPLAPAVVGLLIIPGSIVIPDLVLYPGAVIPVFVSILLSSRNVFAWAIVVAFWVLGVFVGCDFLDRLGHA